MRERRNTELRANIETLKKKHEPTVSVEPLWKRRTNEPTYGDVLADDVAASPSSGDGRVTVRARQHDEQVELQFALADLRFQAVRTAIHSALHMQTPANFIVLKVRSVRLFDDADLVRAIADNEIEIEVYE